MSTQSVTFLMFNENYTYAYLIHKEISLEKEREESF